MRQALFFLFVLTIASCRSTYPNEKKLSYTAPVKVGDDWVAKKTSLGAPDKSGDNFASYFKHGMVVYTTANGAKVSGLVFTWFKGGLCFTGEVYGIKIGDTYPKVVKLWGEPAETGIPQEDFYEKCGSLKNLELQLSFGAILGMTLI